MNLIRTYIDGFDENLEGGIPEGHIILVAGTAGTMKSTLAYYILHHNAINGKKGLYITLEQSMERLLYQMEKLGMKYEEVEENLRILDLGKVRREVKNDEGWPHAWIDILMDLISSAKSEGIDLLVIDSLNVQEVLGRAEFFDFFEFLRGLNLTAFLISEMSQDSSEFSKYGIDFLVDGIFYLRLVQEADYHRYRRIGIIKMRGVNHSMDDFTLIYKAKKLRVTSVIER
jgi:KaiC/GvpD/RAD55 family RecA-like ATPase